MKALYATLAASMMIGCATQAGRPVSTRAAPASLTASAALAFDPPIALGRPAPDLARDDRGGAALVGFEEPSTSSYDVFTYNRQASDYSDYYDQEAISERVGTTRR